MRHVLIHSLAWAGLLATTACSAAPSVNGDHAPQSSGDDVAGRLPTGVRLDPAAPLHDVGQLPLAMVPAPEGDRIVLLLNGWGDEGIDVLPAGYRGNKPFLAAHTNPRNPGFDLAIQDQVRADVWIAELAEFTRRGMMPAMEIVRLPNDHTSALRAGTPTPQAMVADNDLALGRMIEALSKSPFWASTVVFVLEDDAQNGPDHVDSHRAPMLVISPYVRAGVVHRFTNTTDVLRTMEELPGLDALSQFDHFGRPLRDIWSATADLHAYAS